MSSPTIKRTKNSHLQEQLTRWKTQLDAIQAASNDIQQKQRLLDAFVRGFVPLDVTEEDILHYENSLLNDDEFFESLCREMGQCATGERVDEIEGDQTKKATFFLLPPPETLSEGTDFELVRELSFIATDREGKAWRAEG